MIGKILLGVAGIAAGASLSEETKRKVKDAARGLRDDFATTTKPVRERVSREWRRFERFVREDILDEPPRRPPASPPSAPPS